MPSLTIGDKTVTVGDDFLSLSADQQNDTVAHIAQQIGAAPAGPDTSNPRYKEILGNESSKALLRGVPIGQAGYQLEEFARWINVPPINYHVGIDGISMFLVILTTFLTIFCVLCSWNSVHTRVKEFHIALLLLVLGAIGIYMEFSAPGLVAPGVVNRPGSEGSVARSASTPAGG